MVLKLPLIKLKFKKNVEFEIKLNFTTLPQRYFKISTIHLSFYKVFIYQV